MVTCIIEFQPLGRRVETTTRLSLLQAAQLVGVPIASNCGGTGKCGCCKVEVISGKVSAPDQDELAILKHARASETERLACRTRPLGNVKIHIPASPADTQRLQLKGFVRAAEGNPRYTVTNISLPLPSVKDQRSDVSRLLDALPSLKKEEWQPHPFFVRRLSGVARREGWRMAVYQCGGVLVGVAPIGAPPMGIAVDLGTTKIAGLLVDLSSGREICSSGMVNPQIPYGEDLISRLNYALQQKNGGRILAGSLRKALTRLIKKLCNQGGISPEQVVDIVICGNTAMSHLLLELPVEPLARAPYVAGFSTPLEITALELGLKNAPCAKVLVLPCIGGFVGGDHVAMILACGLDQCSDPTLGVDIGTNTEIVLAKPGPNGGIFVSSCASGPAFEGAHIGDGMRAASGAIEKFHLTADGPVISTVNGKPPVGLCGSGLVDAVSELVRVGIINKRGHLQKDDHHRIRSSPKGAACVLVPAKHSGNGQDIVLTQRDISEIQLAKGAIQSGIRTLLAKTGTRVDELVDVYLAGAFGVYLNIENAVSIGLLPTLPKARFVQAGNAAVAGACLALKSDKERDRAASIARKAQHIETAKDPQFNRTFAQSLHFEKHK